ncbi:response regulator [Paenibacillus sp. FSL K6-1096]|uniref:response regulator n=1 Tax=Paenibacillus sp. FSL K6-1096 TaxID=2921460 RepID=UPI0030EB3C0B
MVIRIMIADDEEVIRRGLEKIASRMDLEVKVIGSYGNGHEAWNHLQKLSLNELDLLVTDIKMPRMDGFKLIEAARAHLKTLPIAVLSGFSEFDYARKAMRFGVLDYLLKPIDKAQLYDLLQSVGENKQTAAAAVQGQVPPQPSEGGEHYVVEQMKSILEQEYGLNFELERLAELVGMNASYISRLFKHKTGQTITDYLIGIRITEAKKMLLDHPDLKNYEIADRVGYSDPVYFNKLFKRMCGMTPKEYKGRYRS